MINFYSTCTRHGLTNFVEFNNFKRPCFCYYSYTLKLSLDIDDLKIITSESQNTLRIEDT